MAATIYTIGHSTRSLDEFRTLLHAFGVRVLIDIRTMPGSRRYPHFDKEHLEASMPEAGIEYRHHARLGGRRKAKKDSVNTRWNNLSFRGYADYMETAEFTDAAAELQEIATAQTTAYMCSEAVWWRCHRSMVSDYLKAKDWRVLHIMSDSKAQEHRYTAPAQVEGDKVSYAE